jgi:hypothetical protein
MHLLASNQQIPSQATIRVSLTTLNVITELLEQAIANGWTDVVKIIQLLLANYQFEISASCGSANALIDKFGNAIKQSQSAIKELIAAFCSGGIEIADVLEKRKLYIKSKKKCLDTSKASEIEVTYLVKSYESNEMIFDKDNGRFLPKHDDLENNMRQMKLTFDSELKGARNTLSSDQTHS